MSFLDRFRRKKEQKTQSENTIVLTELEQVCGDDKEAYNALRHTMFYDPRKISMTMKEAAESAKKFEKANDPLRAREMYEVAGGLAIYEGNVKKVVEFFGESQRIAPDAKYLILKNPEKAVAKAQEFYKKTLKH